MVALLELQRLDTSSDPESSAKKAATEKLRAQIPYQVLGHYDRLRSRGKKGLALVRHQVCSECHVSVPLGTVMTVMNGSDIQLCGNCGRYLYVEPAAPPPEPVPVAPKAKRGRKPKKKPGVMRDA